MTSEKLASDFADLPSRERTMIEGVSGNGLHHTPASEDQPSKGMSFRHPERDAAGTAWEPSWEPIETYPEGEIVMLDDGDRQLLGRREMGMWMELKAGDEIAQPDFLPMLWSFAPEQVKYDML